MFRWISPEWTKSNVNMKNLFPRVQEKITNFMFSQELWNVFLNHMPLLYLQRILLNYNLLQDNGLMFNAGLFDFHCFLENIFNMYILVCRIFVKYQLILWGIWQQKPVLLMIDWYLNFQWSVFNWLTVRLLDNHNFISRSCLPSLSGLLMVWELDFITVMVPLTIKVLYYLFS